MTDQVAEFSAYLTIHLDEKEGTPTLFRISPTLEGAESVPTEADKQQDLFASNNEAIHIDYAETEPTLPPAAALCERMLQQCSDSLPRYHELTFIASNLRPAVTTQTIDREIIKKVRESGHALRKTDKVESYGLDRHLADDLIRTTDKLRSTDVGLSLLPSSVLLSLVATFDSLIADGVRELLLLRPERITNSNTTITYKELFSIESLDAAKRSFIDDEVDKLLRGSHDSQVEYIEKLTDIKIREHYERYSNFLEAFERRNVVAHANGMVTPLYGTKCKTYGIPFKQETIGTRASLRPRYLHKAIDILTEFGVLLWFVTWRKVDPQSEKSAFSRLNMIAYEAVVNRRFHLATWLLDFALHKQSKGADEMTSRMMYINLANAFKKLDNRDRCDKTLAELDWSATSDLFSLSLASLREDTSLAASLLKGLASAGKLRAQDFRDWPVFDWIRGDLDVTRSFEEAFGEPLVLRISSPATGHPEPEQLAREKVLPNSSSLDGDTVH